MKKYQLKAVLNYHFHHLLMQSIGVLFTFLINILVAIIISAIVGKDGFFGSGTIDGVVYVYGIVMGLVMFGFGFKMAIENGTTRKTYFYAMLLGFLINAAVWAALAFGFSFLGDLFKTISVFKLLYGRMDLSLLLFLFCAVFMLMMLGIFIRVVIRRTDKKTKFIIFISTVLLYAVFLVSDVLAGGAIGSFMFDALMFAMGFSGAVPNPYIACLFFTAITLIFTVFVYLLLRRAEIK